MAGVTEEKTMSETGKKNALILGACIFFKPWTTA
jgi:hypothetical protein